MNNQDQLNFTGIIKHAWQYRFTLILIAATATIATYGISLFITPLFKTTAVIYPTAPINSGKDVLGLANNFKGLSEFGSEEEAEQLMEVVSGNNLRRRVANRLNLWGYYKIDTADTRKNYYFDNIWNENVSLSLTKFNALRIEVYAVDPQTAANIANTIAAEADSSYRASRKIRGIAAHKAIVASKQMAIQEYNNMVDSLSFYRELGVLDVPNQVKELYRIKAQDLAAGNKDRVSRIEKELKTLKHYSAKVFGFESRITLKAEEIVNIETSEKVTLLEAEQEIPSIFNIDKAEVPEVKAYPRRFLVSISAGLAALILGLFILLFKSYLANEVFNTGKSEDNR